MGKREAHQGKGRHRSRMVAIKNPVSKGGQSRDLKALQQVHGGPSREGLQGQAKAVWSRHLDEVQQQSRRSNSVELTDDRKHGVQQLLFARLPRGGAKAAPSEGSAGASRILRQVSDEQERRRT